MAKKLYGTNTHCLIDYASVAALLAAPSVFKLRGAARRLSYGIGVTAGVLTALTDHKLALKKLLSGHAHGQADTPFIPALLILPWATGALKQANERTFFLGFFAFALTNFLLTDYDAQ